MVRVPAGTEVLAERSAVSICSTLKLCRAKASLSTIMEISLSLVPDTSTRETPDTPTKSSAKSSPSFVKVVGESSVETPIINTGWFWKSILEIFGSSASEGSSPFTPSTAVRRSFSAISISALDKNCAVITDTP